MASSSVIIGQSPLAGTDRPGTVVLPASVHDNGTRVAVNADPGEFESVRLSPSEFLARVPRAERLGQEDARHARREESSHGLWRYALVLLCGVLVTESVVGRRRA